MHKSDILYGTIQWIFRTGLHFDRFVNESVFLYEENLPVSVSASASVVAAAENNKYQVWNRCGG